MQPSPSAETSRLLFPSVRFCMVPPEVYLALPADSSSSNAREVERSRPAAICACGARSRHGRSLVLAWASPYNSLYDRPNGNPDLPALRPQEDGDHARERLPALLRVLGMPNGSPAETWRLLRFLLIRLEPMPASAG